VLMVPACRQNDLTRSLTLDSACPEALTLCASTAEPNDMMFWVFLGPAGVAQPEPAQLVRVGQRCLAAGEAAAADAVPAFTARDFRRLPLPAGGVNVQPPNGRTLINVPTNVFVDADVTVIDTTLLGLPVRVRATPVRYRWSFGDGADLLTEDPGAAYPDLRTTHTYTTPGQRQLQLATVYTGEYSVAGGPWLPIDGEATVTSPAVTLTVLAARSLLVGGSG
jgi:hypothetical protein